MADEIVTTDSIGTTPQPAKRGRPRKEAPEPAAVEDAREQPEEPSEDIPDLPADDIDVQDALADVEIVVDPAPAEEGYVVLRSPYGAVTTVPTSIKDALILSGYTEQ